MSANVARSHASSTARSIAPLGDDPAVLAATIRALEKRLGKAEIEPGNHSINATLEIDLAGILTKEPSQDVQALPEIDWAAAFALVMLRLKASRPDAARILGEVLRAVIACPTEELPVDRGIPDRIRDCRDQITEARENNRQPKRRSGATKWAGDCTIH